MQLPAGSPPSDSRNGHVAGGRPPRRPPMLRRDVPAAGARTGGASGKPPSATLCRHGWRYRARAAVNRATSAGATQASGGNRSPGGQVGAGAERRPGTTGGQVGARRAPVARGGQDPRRGRGTRVRRTTHGRGPMGARPPDSRAAAAGTPRASRSGHCRALVAPLIA